MKTARLALSLSGVALLSTSMLLAQRPGGGGGGASAPVGGGSSSPGATSPNGSRSPFPTQPNPPGNYPNSYPNSESRPIYISGKVVLDNGTPPPEPVEIRRVCGGGSGRIEAYTDGKGHFSFRLGESMGIIQDASSSAVGGGMRGGSPAGMGGNGNFGSGGVSQSMLMNCDLQAYLPGYQSQTVSLAGRRSLDNPEVGTIVLKRIAGVEGLTFSATSALAPKDAKKAYEKALDRMHKQKWEDAQADFQKAVDIYPKYAMAWNALGAVYEHEGQAAEARKAFAQALQSDSKLVEPYIHLANLAARDKNWEEMRDQSAKAIKLDPVSYPNAYFLNGVANFNLHKFDDAEKSLQAAMKLDKRHQIPAVLHLYGLVLAEKRDFTGAAQQLKAYLEAAPNATDADLTRKQLAEVERLGGQTEAAQKTGESQPKQP